MSLSGWIQLFLAFLFALAGAAKLTAWQSFWQTLTMLQVPAGLRGALAVLIPVLELAAACILVLGPWSLLGAWLLLALLVLFAAAVGLVMKSRANVTCNCFGNLLPGYLGKKTLAHIAVLGALDIYLLAAGESDALASASPMDWTLGLVTAAGLFTLYALGSAVYGHYTFMAKMQAGGRKG
ncbi:MauE/DoxX family redox-associated membrane protein [Paenibacillus koleovorans]|uniref:MauE/DoxX family redox-associated membrane protein n=1 Tax=Paenibacillus koleovorans TaxID=121608 RepID=UPI0013E2EC69|nr:MauE/DoxX family redox-associated membrane protein [Paenibacillus koleovorans]